MPRRRVPLLLVHLLLQAGWVLVTFRLDVSDSRWRALPALAAGLVVLSGPLSRWLAKPGEHVAPRLPWALWLWLPVPLGVLAWRPWIDVRISNWLNPATWEYLPNPLLHVTGGLYLFVTALALIAGRPTVPRALLRLAGPWLLFLVALLVGFLVTPRPVFHG